VGTAGDKINGKTRVDQGRGERVIGQLKTRKGSKSLQLKGAIWTDPRGKKTATLTRGVRGEKIASSCEPVTAATILPFADTDGSRPPRVLVRRSE